MQSTEAEKVETIVDIPAKTEVMVEETQPVVELPFFESETELPELELEVIESPHVEIEVEPDEAQVVIAPKVPLVETEAKIEIEQPDYELLAEALPFIVFEQDEVANEDSEVLEKPTLVEQLTVYIETLEPARAEEAEAILDVIMEKIQLIYEEDSTEEQQILEQELEIICVRMLVCMGVEPIPETVKHLLLALKKEYLEQVELAEEEIYDQGTHERKNFTRVLHDLPDIIHPLSSILGKYTLRLVV